MVFMGRIMYFFLGGGKRIKDLEKIAEDFSRDLEDIVFIGDDAKRLDGSDWIDSRSARYFGVSFILIPPGFSNPDYDIRNVYRGF